MKAGEELVKNSSTRTSIYAARKKVVPFERDATFYLRRGLLYYQKNKQEKALLFKRQLVWSRKTLLITIIWPACL